MREFKLKKWVAACLIVSMPYAGFVDAAGLGGMNVLSQLGQPFAAEIDLVNVSKEELSTLNVRLAAPEAYRSANLQFNPALNSLRLVIERRPDGRPFIRATSARPVAEPFLDLLVELSWQGGRIVREYSALLDPPGMEVPPPAVTAPVVSAPTAQVAPAGKPPTVVATPAPAPAPSPATAPAPVAKSAPAAPVAAAPVPATSRPITGSEYAVKQGDTLGQIAAGMRPEGISLDQMMIGLLRANPDAFINNNINLVKTGKILKVPERDQLSAVAQSEATQEVRVHSTNWNAYRAKVADAAPAVAATPPATTGKITARVEDKVAPTGGKDVVVLSKGDGAAGKGDGKAADRVRALQEDLAARDKALAEAKDRVAALEKTISDMKKLAEIKNPAMAAAQQAGKGDPAADAKAAPKPNAKVEAPKAEPPKVDATKAADKSAAETPKPDAAPASKVPPPAPTAPVKAATPPPPAPGIMDTVMDNLLPIGGGAALLAGLAGLWAVRRRKKADDDDESTMAVAKTEPFTGNVAAAAGAAAVVTETQGFAESPVDTVDPIEEAQVYIDHGRDNQAEDILKEAMAKEPQRQDVQLKLLEVYAARGDKGAFNKLAKDFNALTGGSGESWERAAAMGYTVDPGNAMYPAPGGADVDITAGELSDATVDMDLGALSDGLGTTTDILLDQGDTDASMDKTVMTSQTTPAQADPAAEPALPKFNLDLPPPSAEEVKAVDTNVMDFDLDLPQIDAPAPAVPVEVSADALPPPSAEEVKVVDTDVMDFNLDLPQIDAPAPAVPVEPSTDAGLDFKVDLTGIDLNLDDKPATGGGEKDAHWNDVQQKFDLARAYQDIGDKDGAREILREVEREGDAAQRAEAQKLLDSIK